MTTSIVITVFALAMSLMHLYTAGVRLFPAMQQRTMHLYFTLVYGVFSHFPLEKVLTEDKHKDPLSSRFYLYLLQHFYRDLYVHGI